MTDAPASLGLRGLGRNVGGTLLRQSLAVALGLVLTVALARTLGPAGTGQLSLVLFLANLWVTLFGVGLPAANVYNVGRNPSLTACAARTNRWMGVALSAAGLAVGVPFVLWLGPTLFPSVEPASLRLAMLLFPPMLVEAMLLGVLQGREDFGVVNRVGVLVPATALALAAALVVWRMLGVAGALYAYAGAHAVGLGATFWALWRMRDPDRSWRTCRQYATAALDYGWRANLGNLAALVNYRADLYLLNVLLTASAVGVYAAAVQIAEKLWILSAAVSFVILPRIAALHDAEATRRRITPLMARWVLLATVGLSVGVGLFGYPVIRLMGPRFGEAIPVLWFLLPGVALLAVARVISADLAARGRPELNVVATLAGVAVEVVGIALLVPRVGLLGAASASSLSYASSCAMSLWFYGRITKVRPWTPLVPTRDDRQLIRAVGTLVGGWLRAGAPGERLGG